MNIPSNDDLPTETDLDGPVLPDSIGFHIRMVQMRIFREFYRVFEGSGVTPGMHTVLAIIRDNPTVRQRALAEMLMVREPNMTRMIHGLQKSGLIAREIDSNDRRAFHLVLTDQGNALMDGVTDRLALLEARLLGGLKPSERVALRAYLDKLVESIA